MSKTLEPEQWRVLDRLIYLCGKRARLADMLKSQDANPESVVDLAQRELIVAKLNGEQIDLANLTPAMIQAAGRNIFLTLSAVGESRYWDDPRRVLRPVGWSRHGLDVTFVTGMISFDDLAELARTGLVYAITITDDDPVDLTTARHPFCYVGSGTVICANGVELSARDVLVRTTKAGQLYCSRQ